MSLHSINAIYITVECEKHSPWSGQVEVDKSYFGPRRVRGKREQGASKTIVFGLYKRNGWVSTEIVPDVKKATLQQGYPG